MCGGCKIDTVFSCVLSLLEETKSKSRGGLTHSASKHWKRCSRRIMLPGLVWRLKPLHIKRSFEIIILFSRLKINIWVRFYGAGLSGLRFLANGEQILWINPGHMAEEQHQGTWLSLPHVNIYHWGWHWTYNTMSPFQASLLGQVVPFKWPPDHLSIKKAIYICMGVYIYVHVCDVCDWKSPLFLDLDICIIGFISFFFFFFFKPLEKQFSIRQPSFPPRTLNGSCRPEQLLPGPHK